MPSGLSSGRARRSAVATTSGSVVTPASNVVGELRIMREEMKAGFAAVVAALESFREV